MREFWEDQAVWSEQTFGPSPRRGPIGPLKHLMKEAQEAIDEVSPHRRAMEIADCLFLVFDAARRHGMTYDDLFVTAYAKLEENKKRVWPDWRYAARDSAIEHYR